MGGDPCIYFQTDPFALSIRILFSNMKIFVILVGWWILLGVRIMVLKIFCYDICWWWWFVMYARVVNGYSGTGFDLVWMLDFKII